MFGDAVTGPKKDILQGWKDIAAYVSRDVRTVKRWEKQRGLPVRRMPGDGRANVYALISELDSWLSSGLPADREATPEAPIDAEAPPTPEPIVTQPDPLPPQQTGKQQLGSTRRRWIYTAAAILSLAALTTLAVEIRAHYLHTSALRTSQADKPGSRVDGVDALYLRGLYFYEQRTPDTLDRALKCFQDAIAKDPGYAPAYAGLAQTYNLTREYSMMPEAEAYAKAQAAAEHAIALDPNLSEAHASLGFIKFFWDWDPAAAEREFHTSIRLDPNSALGHHWYASMLMHQARFPESLLQFDLAQRLQPTSISILSDHAYALGLSGHRGEAADILQEIVNEDPRSSSPHYIYACLSLLEPRDIARYLDQTRRAAILRHDPQQIRLLDMIEPAYRSGGAPALWRALLDEQQRLHPSPKDRTYQMAQAEALLNLHNEAFRDLTQLAKRHDPHMIGILIDPLLGSLRSDPRFIPLASRMGLPFKH